MKYTDLTIDQKISLKGEIQNNPLLANYKAVMLLWGFVLAIEFFLTDDINLLNERLMAV